MLARTTAGDVRGIEKDGVVRFRGIPFAAPPVGPGRFRPPGPLDPWKGVRDAVAPGPMARQVAGGLEALLGARGAEQSEDCLYLNVTTPACDDRARPVMVWIHGGGFTTGSGSIPWYSGLRLAALDDVVVVSVNYRLGAFGFTHLPQLGDAYAGSGNCGILDQVAALRWVQANIAEFGGDPANVTVFGESAGGMSIGTLLGMPGVPGALFGRAIPQSGACQSVSTAAQGEATAAALVDAAGCSAEGLLDLDADALLEASQAVNAQRLGGFARGDGPNLPFQPVVDGVVLERQPLDAVTGGSAAGVDVLTGTTADEFTLFLAFTGAPPLDDEQLRRRAAQLVGEERVDDLLAAYRDEHPGASPDELAVAVLTDRVFRLPAEELLEAQHPHGTVRSYRFTYATPAFDGVLRSCHALDVPFTFDVAEHPTSAIFCGEPTDATRLLGATMRQAWTAFARSGEPSAPALPDWPSWHPEHRPTMALGERFELLLDPLPRTRTAWAG